MPQTQSIRLLVQPLEIVASYVAYSVDDLADVLLMDSDVQVANKKLADSEERQEFLMGCDALNLWRLQWRLREEPQFVDDLVSTASSLREIICERRGYDAGEFSLAEEATEQRARFPFGLDPLRYASLLANKRPIRALNSEIQDPLCQRILGIAVHLQRLNGPKPVLLPIEQLRTVLKARKLVVGGAVKRLQKHNLLFEVGEKAHTGRAREFRVGAMEGIDYEYEKSDPH
ncbi:MAG: hypothetical protein AB7O68_00610 [Pirellulales bacterium]